MNCDSFIFENTNSKSTPNNFSSPFVKKDIVFLEDQNYGSYESGQVIFNTAGMSNSSNWLSFSEGLLYLPICVGVVATGVDFTANGGSDFMIAIKNSYLNFIDKIKIEMGGNTIVSDTSDIAQFLIFKQHCSMSQDEINVWGDTIGYYPDNVNSWRYSDTAGRCGHGLTNNMNASGIQLRSSSYYKSNYINDGMRKRQETYVSSADCLNASTDGRGALYTGGMQTSQMAGRNYVYTNTTTTSQKCYFINAFIRLKDMLLFYGMPLLKSVYFKITINVNTCIMKVSRDGPTWNLTCSNTSFKGSSNPVLFAGEYIKVPTAQTNTATNVEGNTQLLGSDTTYIAGGSANVGTSNTATDFWIKVAIGKITDINGTAVAFNHPVRDKCVIYAPSYTFQPKLEEAYYSLGQISHKYTDTTMQIIPVSGSNITGGNGLSQQRLRRIVIIPMLAESSNGNGLGLAPKKSPFTTEPATTSPLLSLIYNFQIRISIHNQYHDAVLNTYEFFLGNGLSYEGLNGNQVKGLNSSIFNKIGAENSYGYIDCPIRYVEGEESNKVSQIFISGSYAGSKAMDLYVWMEYEREIVFDVATGAGLKIV